MHTRIRFQGALLASVMALACAGSSLAVAAGQRICPEPTKEEREKMAVAHEQMAACLRSDKSFADCHKEMAKSHPMMGCPGAKMRPHGAQKQEN